MDKRGKLILICGDLASGKSTLSNKISNDYSLVCFNKDNLKEILGDVFLPRNREENLVLSRCVFEIFKYICVKECNFHNNFILESNFRNNEFEYLKSFAYSNNYDILSIVLRADIKVLHARFMHRINYENRHFVHKAVDYSLYEDFEKQIISDRVRNYPGLVINVDTTDFNNIDYKSLYERINEFLY